MAADEAIERADRGAARDEGVDQMGANESRSPRDEHSVAAKVRYWQFVLSLSRQNRRRILCLHDVRHRLPIDTAAVDDQGRVANDEVVVDVGMVGHDHDGVLGGEPFPRERLR